MWFKGIQLLSATTNPEPHELKHTLLLLSATYFLGFSNWVVFPVLRWPDGQLKMKYALKNPEHMATPSNKQKQIAPVFHFYLTSKLLACRECALKHRKETNIYHCPLIQNSSVHQLSHTGWNFTVFRHLEGAFESYTVPAGDSDKKINAGLQHQLCFSREAGTKHLHKKSSWAHHYYLCIPPENERRAGSYPARVKYYRGRAHQDELRQHKASTQFRGLKSPRARAKW